MRDDIDGLDRFLITLDWLLAVQARYPNQLSFGLLHVCFHGQHKLGQVYGAPIAFKLLKGLSDQLSSEFRKTDLVARDGVDYWVLVPYTEPETVTEKVSRLIELASASGLEIVDRDVAIFSLHDPLVTEAAAKHSSVDFLAHLKANRQIAKHWAQVARQA